MLRQSFNKNWTIAPPPGLRAMLYGGNVDNHVVALPYDYLLEQERTPDGSASTGYYPNMALSLKKTFDVPAEWENKTVIFEFEGVYTNSTVLINGNYAGGFPHGYSNFYVEANSFLKYGETNTIEVAARTQDDSRWYTGVGAYRNVKIMIADLVHIVPDSYRITTLEADENGATVSVTLDIVNRGHKTVTTSVTTALTDRDGKTVSNIESTLTAFAGQKQTVHQRFYIEGAKRWSIDDPYLYNAYTTVNGGDNLLDEEKAHFGIRTLQLDPKHGLRINGKTVKLRGACVHHDNGLIGAAAIERAEERRVEILKSAGFNAVRSAHNPISKAFLDACDRIGMVVMDEVSDMWSLSKTAYDFSTSFPLCWETVCERIVGKDFNHPSVIMYSIGNEIPEAGSPHGADIGRKLAEKIRSLDSTRYVTNSINSMLAVIDKLKDILPTNAGAEINETMTNVGDMMSSLNDSDLVTYSTKESYDYLDLCGYNYATSRYELDKKLFPHRVLVGSETTPLQIAENWAEITKYDHAIGDFTWTGWDYIGEAGIGKMEYEEDGAKPGFDGDYPWYIAYCGDMDITGLRRPISYWREIVFGLRTEPYIAVDYPKNFGKTLLPGMWTSFDAIGSWSWDGFEGKPVLVNVFGCGNRFELLLNNRKVAEGELAEFKGTAVLNYEPGQLVAVTYDNQIEIGRTTLVSAKGPVHLELEADRKEIRGDDTDLCYVEITLRGENGIINNVSDRKITAEVTGPGILAGLGTGCPKTIERFCDGSFTTFDGRALAIIRPNSPGIISLTVEAEGLGKKTISVEAK